MNKDKTISFRITEEDEKKIEAIKKYYKEKYPEIKNFNTSMILDICLNNTWEQIGG